MMLKSFKVKNKMHHIILILKIKYLENFKTEMTDPNKKKFHSGKIV